MKRLLPARCLAAALAAAFCLHSAPTTARAQTATSPAAAITVPPGETTGDDDEPPTGESGPALSRLTVTQRGMAALLQRANDALKTGAAPAEVARQFYADLARIEGLKSPMVALNDLKTRLTNLGVADAVLGEKFPLGGTPVERALLVYRRDLTMDCIRAAVADVTARFGADATGKVFLAKIGKWAVQNPDMFMLAGDIDFSFMGARPDVILALRDAFADTIKRRSGGLDMVAIDSVATAHGFAEHMVYMGIQGRKFADDAMMGMDTGVEQIDFRNPDSVGTPQSRQLTGKQALTETVLEETARRYREQGYEARGRSLANETEKAWNDRRSQTVEPMLSMEMARHLEHDIIANLDVFTALDLVKKGSKYLRRSNDQITSDLKIDSASPEWAKFVEQVDEKAKQASAEELSTFIHEELTKLGMPDLFALKLENGRARLEVVPGGAEKFLATVKEQIWKNVSSGLDVRIRTMTDALNLRGRAAGPGTPDDLRPDRIADTVRMLAAGLEAMQHDHGRIPPDIVTKVSSLTKIIEAQARQRAFALPEEEMKKIREVLREATANENSLLLKTAACADHIDKWMTRHYDTLAAKIPASLQAKISLADAKIDALNNLLDHLDNSTVAAMRERGIIKAPIPIGLSEDGTVQFLKVAEFPSIGAINQRLNQSILGKIGNNTAFKAFNLAQEGDAYYAALTQASTPGEAFQNLATEIFRRRVPGGGAVEAAVMGNYLRASVEVVYLLFPPAAIPEGLYGIAMSVSNKYDAWWWSSELERYVDTFYTGAEFELVTPTSQNERRRFRLTSLTIKHPGATAKYTRAQIEDGTAGFFQNPDVDKTLWENIAVADPFIQLMDELKKHKAAGEKVRARFQQQQNEHWAKLKADFGKNLIERFENRKASETAIDLGEVPGLYAELITIAGELEIKDPLHAAMDKDWDSSYLQRLWVWLKAEKRDVFNEAPPEAEKTRAVTILRKYLDAYRQVRDARTAAETALDAIFSEAALTPPPHERDNRRVLTRIVFLRCHPEADAALAARLRAAPASTLEKVRAQLDAIIETKAPGAKRDEKFDREMAARITGEVYWIAALRATQVPVLAKGELERDIAAHATESDRFIAEFTAFYVNQTGALSVRVRQWIDDAASEQPVTGATLALGEAKFREISDGTYQALGVKAGRHALSVSAPGFVARSGAAKETVSLEVGSDRASREFDVFLKASGDGKELGVAITTSLEPALIFTRGETTSIDLRATVTAKKDSGKLTYQWSLGDEVLLQGSGDSRLTYSAPGRTPGDHTIKLFVTDEKLREGTGEIVVRVVDGEPLKVVLGEHRDRIFKNDDETLSIIEPRGGPGLGFTYRWVFKDAGGRQVFAQDGADLDRQLIAGRNHAGQKLTISVAVRDRDGRTGSATTVLEVLDEEKPEALAVTIAPASGTLKVGDRLTLTASATAFSDSGAIEFSWDDGKTWSAQRTAAEITAEQSEAGTIQSVTVMARDKRGRTGEATAGIRVEKKFDDTKVVGDDDEFEIGIEAPGEIRLGDTLTARALLPRLSAKRASQLTLVWYDQTGGREAGRGPSIQITPPRPGEYSLSVSARENPNSYGSTYGFGGHEYIVLPTELLPVTFQSSKNIYTLGEQGTVYANVEADWLAWGKRRYDWKGASGTRESADFTAHREGEMEISVEVFAIIGTKEVLVGRGSTKVLVSTNKLELPPEIMATDIFTVTAKVPPAVAARVKGYRWSGAATIDPKTGKWTHWNYTPETAPETKMQMHPDYFDVRGNPPEDPTTSISVSLVDEKGFALLSLSGTTVLKPACFTGSMSGAWEGGPWYGGFHAKRQPQKSAIRHDENGRAYSSASAWAQADAKWGRYGEDPEPGFREDAVKKTWEITSFTIDDFKGFVAIEPGIRWYRGTGNWMTGYTASGASRTGFGFVRKGGAVISINFMAASSGSWDNSDEGWQKAQVAALFSEARGLLEGLMIEPDPKFEKKPYTGPALDGSDEVLPLAVSLEGPPGGKLGFGQTANLTARVSGGRAPHTFTWSGDHGGTGASVTVIPTTPGEHTLSVNVKSADGQSADASVSYAVEKITATIGGLEPPVIYGTTRTITLAVTGATGVRALWQSSPHLTFDPPESTDGRTTVRFDRAPSGGAKIWAQLTNTSGATIGEATQVNVEVKPPKFALKIDDPAPRVGREIPVTIATTPAVDAALIDYRWLEPATSQRREINDNASQITVATRELKPLALVAQARVPGSGDDLGEIRGEIKPVAYKLKAWVVEPGTRPMIWKEGTGLVPVERGTYAGDELVGVAADFDGDKPEGDVRWAWTANEGTTVSAPASRTTNASRHETGTASLTITARDKDNITLGTTNVSFSVTVPAAEVQKALQPVVALRADRAEPVTNEPLVFTAEVTRGTPPYRYTWTGVQSTTATATFTATKPGKITASVTVTDAKGKTATASLDREVKLGERDRARQEAERLAGVARDAARRGDFDAAVKAIEDARRADPSLPELLKTATREVIDAAQKAAQAAEAKRDFAAAGKLFTAAAKLDPQDAEAAKGLASTQAFQKKLDALRAAQKELEATLAKRDLDAATAQLEAVKVADAALPGTTSAETNALATRVQQAVAEYTRDVAAQKQAVEADKNAKRYQDARTKLTTLSQQRPLRRDDAAWAKTLLAELEKLIAADAGPKPDKPDDRRPGDASKPPGEGATPGAPAGGTGGGSAGPGGAETPSRPKPHVPALTGTPVFGGELGTKWDKTQAAGGNFDRFARFEGGALVVDVPAGNHWGKTGIVSREATFTLGAQPTSVVLRLDPARTTGFGVAFAAQPHGDVWMLHNVWLTWTRPASAVQADLWFGNTQNAADGRLSELITAAPPAELVFTLRPGRADVRLPDGRTRSITIGWLKEGTPIFTHLFAHPAEANRPARLALTGVELATGAPPPATPVPATPPPTRLDIGALGDVWDKLQSVGGNFDRFARFDRGALVVDVPAGNHWGKTGLLSRERLFTLGEQPMTVVVRLDPARTTGFCVAFAAQPHGDVWALHNVWFTWTRPGGATQASTYFGNTQNGSDGHAEELLAPNAPAELVFTLQPGRADLRLPDGRTRSINIGWLKSGTPIFAHVFAHPAEANRAAKLALTGIDVLWGPAPAATAAPLPLDRASTDLPVDGPGDVWDKLQAAGGNFDAFARFERGGLAVDVPAGNHWGKTGLLSRERLFTLGREPVRIAVRIDPARSNGFCFAFASSPHGDVWVLSNVWLTWTVAPEAKEADLNFLNTQNAGDGQCAEKLPLTPPGEFHFTLQPGRADVRLPDGRTRSIGIGWLKEGTPIFGHFFAHSAAAGLPAKLALTGVSVSFGAPASAPISSGSPATAARSVSLVDGAGVSLARSRFAPSERIEIGFTTPSGLPSNAWMGIIPASIEHGDQARNDQHDVAYQHLSGRTAATLVFGPFAPGEWTARINALGREYAWAAFTVAPEVVPPGQNSPSLALERTRFAPSEQIPVRFTAPAAYPGNAWVGIVPAGVDHGDQARNDQHDVAYQHVSGRVEGTMTFAPPAPGEWTARMNVFGIETASVAFTVAPEVVPPGQNPPSLTVSRARFCPWERIPISFTAPTAYPGNAWVGLIPAGIDHGDQARNDQHDVAYQHVSGRAEGTMTFAPLAPGEWTARMNVFGIETTSAAFTVAVEVVPPGQNPPTLALGKSVFTAGETIAVTFTAPTAYPGNSWVGLIPAAVDHGSVPRNDQHDVAYQHLSGRGSGTLSFRAPAPGRWSFRMNTGDGRAETASVDFEVR